MLSRTQIRCLGQKVNAELTLLRARAEAVKARTRLHRGLRGKARAKAQESVARDLERLRWHYADALLQLRSLRIQWTVTES